MMSECPFDYYFAFMSFEVGTVCTGCLVILAISLVLWGGRGQAVVEYGGRNAVRGVLITWALAVVIEVSSLLALVTRVGPIATWIGTHGRVEVLAWPASTIVALSSVFFLRNVAGRVKVIGWSGVCALALLGVVGGGGIYGLIVNHCGRFLGM